MSQRGSTVLDVAPAGAVADRLEKPRSRTSPLRVALIGNPNTGKSTLFNALTGMRQRVANFPGVTVERVEGTYRSRDGSTISVLDLPGSYSLSARSPDEAIAIEVLIGGMAEVSAPDVVVVVAEAQHLERNLFLASQVLELGVPVVLALNQIDVAQAEGIEVDFPALIGELGVTVIPTVATRGDGIEHLRSAILAAPSLPRPTRRFALSPAATAALAPLEKCLRNAGLPATVAAMDALRLLAVPGIEPHLARVPGLGDAVEQARRAVTAAGHNPSSLEAEARYQWIAGVVRRTIRRVRARRPRWSDRLDHIVLHRVWGPIVFLALMGIVFQSIFTWATPFADGIEGALGWVGDRVGGVLPPGDLRSLIVDGVIGGVGSVLVFIPQIAFLFLFIAFLEDSGYMARAACVMDRVMRRVGLDGKSFIPLLSGYACAVPAIMATRTIEHRRDRLATIMVLPMMSCSARLPVYTLLIGAFVPSIAVAGFMNLQGLTMLGMYLLGTLTALVAAALLKGTILRGPASPLLIELPAYRMPTVRGLFLSAGHRVMAFVRRAGTIILALSIVLWAGATYPRTVVPEGVTESAAQEMQLANSALGRMGRAIEPVVRPLGYDWKIGVSIISSFAAREVFVSSMATIYGVGDGDEAAQTTALSERLVTERDPSTGRAVYTPLVATGLMVFYVFALMCASTVAVTVRETGGGQTGWGWAAFQFGYMLVLAYGAAFVVYQGGRALGLG